MLCNNSHFLREKTDEIKKARKGFLHPRHWDDVPLKHVKVLPYDIDGHCRYSLPCNQTNLMPSSKDGRPWQAYISSSRKGFEGVRRIAECKGSYVCNNIQCPYIQQFKTFNTVQFESSGSRRLCSCCGYAADQTPCEARKIWEFEDGHWATTVIIYHEGTHTCTAVKPSRPADEYVNSILKENKHMKPVQIPNHTITKMIEDGCDWNETTNKAREFTDVERFSKLKSTMKKKINPHGHSFDAVTRLREKAREKDRFYIYSFNNRDMNPSNPTYVFKTSTVSLNIALNMHQSKDHFMREEYCYFDGTHGRCHGLKTLTLWTYHPLLRKIVKLATMDCERENQECITLFWKLWNDALSEISADPAYKFDPKGWCVDEAGANWSAIEVVFGSEALSKCKSCEFHYKDCRNRHRRSLSTQEEKDKFTELTDRLLYATTTVSYQKIMIEILNFIDEVGRPNLKSWVNWWHDRRGHIFRSWRPANNPPNTNLAEVGHSSWLIRELRTWI